LDGFFEKPGWAFAAKGGPRHSTGWKACATGRLFTSHFKVGFFVILNEVKDLNPLKR